MRAAAKGARNLPRPPLARAGAALGTVACRQARAAQPPAPTPTPRPHLLQVPLWTICGGLNSGARGNWTDAQFACCPDGAFCRYYNVWHWQCEPGTGPAPSRPSQPAGAPQQPARPRPPQPPPAAPAAPWQPNGRPPAVLVRAPPRQPPSAGVPPTGNAGRPPLPPPPPPPPPATPSGAAAPPPKPAAAAAKPPPRPPPAGLPPSPPPRPPPRPLPPPPSVDLPPLTPIWVLSISGDYVRTDNLTGFAYVGGGDGSLPAERYLAHHAGERAAQPGSLPLRALGRRAACLCQAPGLTRPPAAPLWHAGDITYAGALLPGQATKLRSQSTGGWCRLLPLPSNASQTGMVCDSASYAGASDLTYTGAGLAYQGRPLVAARPGAPLLLHDAASGAGGAGNVTLVVTARLPPPPGGAPGWVRCAGCCALRRPLPGPAPAKDPLTGLMPVAQAPLRRRRPRRRPRLRRPGLRRAPGPSPHSRRAPSRRAPRPGSRRLARPLPARHSAAPPHLRYGRRRHRLDLPRRRSRARRRPPSPWGQACRRHPPSRSCPRLRRCRAPPC
jgi:hypothetical protein